MISSVTDPNDAAVLLSLKNSWQNTPPSWDKSNDPCDSRWEGVTCNNARVSRLGLSNTSLKGKLYGDINGLTELRSLILAGCSFNGEIPDELGNLAELSFFHLNKNQLAGFIPAKLFSSKMALIHLLLDGNRFTGTIPVTLGLIKTLEVL
ncbi:hypothetical protein ACE6H2_021985 [Prunus campanulata]